MTTKGGLPWVATMQTLATLRGCWCHRSQSQDTWETIMILQQDPIQQEWSRGQATQYVELLYTRNRSKYCPRHIKWQRTNGLFSVGVNLKMDEDPRCQVIYSGQYIHTYIHTVYITYIQTDRQNMNITNTNGSPKLAAPNTSKSRGADSMFNAFVLGNEWSKYEKNR